MKKLTAILLTLTLLLTLGGCGQAKKVDLAALYDSFSETLPEMAKLSESAMMNYFGIDSADCAQYVTAITSYGMRADELWLIEAKDADALRRVKTLAESRLKAKGDETVNYDPAQYAVVEKGRILVSGNYLALIISPDVETLEAGFKAAMK